MLSRLTRCHVCKFQRSRFERFRRIVDALFGNAGALRVVQQIGHESANLATTAFRKIEQLIELRLSEMPRIKGDICMRPQLSGGSLRSSKEFNE
jgi:hypothetical protein